MLCRNQRCIALHHVVAESTRAATHHVGTCSPYAQILALPTFVVPVRVLAVAVVAVFVPATASLALIVQYFQMKYLHARAYTLSLLFRSSPTKRLRRRRKCSEFDSG